MVRRYEEGQFDYMKGIKDNPYEKGTWDRKEWQRGWEHQQTWLQKYNEYKRNTSLFS